MKIIKILIQNTTAEQTDTEQTANTHTRQIWFLFHEYTSLFYHCIMRHDWLSAAANTTTSCCTTRVWPPPRAAASGCRTGMDKETNNNSSVHPRQGGDSTSE